MNNPETKVSFNDLYGIICETLEKEGTVTFTANGTSMLPMIRGGIDRVTVSSLPEQVRKGDVVFYRRSNGTFILHRVVSAHKDLFTLCGDNQFHLEKNVSKKDMIGVLTGLDKDGKPVDFSSVSTRLYIFFLPLRRLFLHFRYDVSLVWHKLFKKS